MYLNRNVQVFKIQLIKIAKKWSQVWTQTRQKAPTKEEIKHYATNTETNKTLLTINKSTTELNIT